jgi:hypothetical protein
MGIQFVGGVTSSRVGTTSTTTQSLTSLAGGMATAPAQGDLVVVACGVGSQGRNNSQAITGYTTVGTQLNRADDTYDASLQISYKFMTATPDTSITIPSTGSADDGQAWAVMVFRGVDSTTPFDVTSVSATLNNTANFDAAAITPVSQGAWIVIAGCGAAATGAVFTAPTDFTTNWLSSFGADTNDAIIGMGYYTRWSSGSYNPAAVAGGSADVANSWAAWTLALRPAYEVNVAWINVETLEVPIPRAELSWVQLETTKSEIVEKTNTYIID